MSVSPDPVEASVPPDPSTYRARPLMGPVAWALVGAVIALVLVGAVTWAAYNFAPGLRQVAPLPILPPLRAPAEEPAPAPRPIAAQPPAPAAPADVGQLSDRLAALEAAQARLSSAAAAALASAVLVEAADGSQPFAQELANLEAVSPDDPELQALRPLARTGAPSRASLTASFPDYAARAAVAARAPTSDSGLGDRIAYAVSRVITVRRVGGLDGPGVDAILARAEAAAADRDFEKALREIDSLPPAAREAMAPWRARAERRVEIDRRVTALRNRAVSDLARARGAAG